MMYLEQLHYLTIINETGSFTAAARCLYVTQQAISRSIQQLEKELDIPILIRTRQGLFFTEQGKKVLDFAQTVLSAEEDLIHELGLLKMNTTKSDIIKINICSTSPVINIVLPKIIANAEKRDIRHDLKISITDNVSDLLEQLISGERDIGLISVNERSLLQALAPYESILQLEIFAEDKAVIVMERRYYKGGSEYFDFQANHHPCTLYNIIPISDESRTDTIVCSSDADFHRSMMAEAGAVVCMPALAQRYFFNRKKYLTLQIKEEDNPVIVHAAIHRKDANKTIDALIAMIRAEMQRK